MNQFRKCHCGKDLRMGGSYPLDGHSVEKHASGLVYSCEDGHSQHVPRYTMQNPCPTCGNNDWGFKLVGNNNSQWTCKTCEFRIYQTGVLHFYKFELEQAESSCILCNAESAYLIVDSHWDYHCYHTEKDEGLNIKMPSVGYQCLNCSASYYLKKCPYCNSWNAAMSEKRERQSHGREWSTWSHKCHCHNCHNEWYVGSGWSD